MSAGMAKIVVRIPVGRHHDLCAHVEALGTTMSERARTLLLDDLDRAPGVKLAPDAGEGES